MQQQDFGTNELKDELERSLGFKLRSIERLDGASALNFKAVRASDGFTFAVKCSPPIYHERFARLVEHLESLKGSKAVRRVFEKECPPTFHGYNLLCTDWCFGVRIFPDRLTDSQLDACLDEYLAFSDAMQNVRTFDPARTIKRWRDEAFGKCRGLSGAIMRRILDGMLPEECDYHSNLLRVIHGDFHHGNFLFVDGKVDRYLDLEEFRQGYPADDMLRFFVCAAEHLRWYAWRRKRRTLRAFARAVRRMPYSRHEWMFSINARFISKMYMRTWKSECFTLGQALNLAWRHRLYRTMRKIVDDSLDVNRGQE